MVSILKNLLEKYWEDEESRYDYKNKEKPSRGSWFLFFPYILSHAFTLRNSIFQEKSWKNQEGFRPCDWLRVESDNLCDKD